MVDLSARAERLDDYLEAADLEAVWFTTPAGFAWVTGTSGVVDPPESGNADRGLVVAGYDGTFRAVTTNAEGPRLREEVLPDAFAVETVPWYGVDLAEALADRTPTPAAVDVDVPGFERVDAARLRQPLTAADVGRYRELGREAAAALETVCRNLEPTDPEYEVAAGIRIALASRNVTAPAVLVGGSERAQAYRRCTPTDADLGDYALVSLTAERGGLYVSLTRTVVFDPPEWLKKRHRAAARVETTALAATRDVAPDTTRESASRGDRQPTSGREDPAGTAGDVFDAIREAYTAVGFPEEWQEHHQGGAAGYAAREWIATPESTTSVTAPMAYAWNPTVRGARSEDTSLVADDRIELLTKTGRWPTLEVDAVGYDLTLDRHAPVVLDG